MQEGVFPEDLPEDTEEEMKLPPKTVTIEGEQVCVQMIPSGRSVGYWYRWVTLPGGSDPLQRRPDGRGGVRSEEQGFLQQLQ